jgi:hypothetical protein
MIKGKCECGRVRYEVDSEIEDYSHCHCSQCRRLHGAAFASFGGVRRDGFRYLSGEPELKIYASSNDIDRVFCGNCGSNIMADFKPEPEMLYITMGTLDGDPPCPPAYHQFVGSKAPWYEIGDALPQNEEWPDD